MLIAMAEIEPMTRQEVVEQIRAYVNWMDREATIRVWEELAVHGMGYRAHNVRIETWAGWEDTLGKLVLNRIVSGLCAERVALDGGVQWGI